MKFKSLLSILLGFSITMSLCSCTGLSEDDESTEESSESQTVNIEDDDYYSRFRGQNISINVYNWGDYISTGADYGTLDVNAEFEKLTGIKINYTNYATNEELYAKLRSGGSSYDVIIPSDYMISRMTNEGMIQKLDFNNIPNFEYINESFVNPEYDRNNEYSVPYTWGTVGIIYNKTVVTEEEIGWDILWNEKYKGDILMFDNPRDSFAIAQLYLGYSVNTEDPEELEECRDILIEQKPLVQAYVMDEIFDKIGGNDAAIAPYYAGDALTIMDENEDIDFVIPESGTSHFVDAFCIPTGAKHKEAAEMYINFMCEPDIAFATVDYIGYSTPHIAAFEMLDDEIKEDGISYPDDEYLSEKTEVFKNLSDKTNLLTQSLWTQVKSADDSLNNVWIMPAFLFVCISLIILIIIRRYYKNKKDVF